MANLKLIHKDFFTETYESYFENKPVRFIKNIFTGEIKINADDVCKILDLGKDVNTFLGTDKGLDFISEWKKENPNKPVFGDRESGALFEKANFPKKYLK